MAAIGILERFVEGDDWETFIESLDQYFVANELDTDSNAINRRTILLIVCGSTINGLIKNLLALMKPTDKAYAELCTLVREHHKPKESILMARGQIPRGQQELRDSMRGQSVRWSLAIAFSLWSLAGSVSQTVPKVFWIHPRYGSKNGATRLTIKGQGFSGENQFNYGAGNEKLGNSVQLVSETRSIPCDVEKDSSHETQIICYTRPLPEDTYHPVVSVDGVPIDDSNRMTFYIRDYNTPTIVEISPVSGLPGQLITIRGRIFTDIYGSDISEGANHRNTRILRVYAGGMLCELLHPDSDMLYGLKLDYKHSDKGTMTCKMTGTYVGHHNVSFILDNGYGRSLPHVKTYFVSSLNKLSMFQTYAEVTGIYPSQGSKEGGTRLTVTGRFFDKTDAPVRVTIGGQSCEILSVNTTEIICRIPKEINLPTTIFPGGRGLKVETWQRGTLNDLPSYNESTPGYSVSWIGEALYKASTPWLPSVTRLSGFFVAPETDNYRFYIRGSGKFALYFSLTRLPQDKVKVDYGTWRYYQSGNQRSDTLQLQKGKEYYTEVVLQENNKYSFVEVGVHRESSSYTEQQTADAVSEVQIIRSHAKAVDEKQILTLENWTMGSAVSEVQTITVTSPCQESGACSYHWYRLIYNQEYTGLLPVDASASQIQLALTDLWSIRPDKVKVLSTAISQGFIYTVTFISTRGDFDLLQYEVLGGINVTIKVLEQTKGKPSMDTFTLNLDGVNSRPLSHTATTHEVEAALEELVGVKCPDHIAGYKKGYAVKYFNDFENDLSKDTAYEGGKVTVETDAFCGRYSVKNPKSLFGLSQYHHPVSLTVYKQLCFAYKGDLRNNLLLSLNYKNDVTTVQTYVWFQYHFAQENQWSYTCIDLLNFVQSKFPGGSNFLLNALYLYKGTSGQDFFVDTVYIGQQATMNNQGDILMRARPPLFDKGIIIEQFIVTQRGIENARAYNQYEVTMVPFNCSYNIPLLEVGFAQAVSNGTKDESAHRGSTWPEGSVLRVRRIEAATPPVTGTLDIEVFGRSLKGLPVDSTASEMQYALQTIPEIGTVSVTRTGSCSVYQWVVKWLSKAGNQPTLQINDTNVSGVNARITVYNQKHGGLFSHLTGDLFRTPHAHPQVEVLINGIPSNCSGNCGYKWNFDKTPVISGISPTMGKCSSGTVLTISGSRFANSSKTDTTWVSVGNARCPITGLTDTEMTCMIGIASNTSSPLTVYIADLGLAKHSGNQTFTFTYQLEVTSISPSMGSTEGGTILTISGYSFTHNSTVLIGEKTCLLLKESPVKMKCSTPAASVGVYNISVIANGISSTVPFFFTYIDVKIPVISQITPTISSVTGGSNLTIYGSDFGNRSEDSFVFIGSSECLILGWSTNSITCRLPSLPPGNYSIYTKAHVSSSVNASIEYVLRVTEMTPLQGSLYGGTKITISGSGFSPTPEDNIVQFGSVPCHITFASPNILKCVLDPTGRSFIITNNGSHQTLGVGYDWNPSILDIYVGDTVRWQWEAPPLIQGLRYRVFTVYKPSDVTYKGNGFISGVVGTASGSFSYRFTSPGSFFYSSGYVDQKESIFLQGMVNVRPAEKSTRKLRVYLAGIEADYIPGHSAKLDSQQEPNDNCTAWNPDCDQASHNTTDVGGFTFLLSPCYSPTINSITPSNGTMYDRLTITGTAFSNISCANEVRVGAHPCIVENNTENELLCRVDPEGVMEVGIAALVTVTVRNLGTAVNTLADEFSRRFVLLPHVDNISPSIGSPTGKTRVTITGSGFGSYISAVKVLLANVPCSLVSVNYTQVICDSSPSIVSNGTVELSIHGFPAVRSGPCDYSYTESATPIVLNIFPNLLSAVDTELTVTGSGFGTRVDMAFILVGEARFVPDNVSDTSMNCTVGPVPVGQHSLRVLILNQGVSPEGIPVTSAAKASLSPASGSINGGTILSITGNGFVQGGTTVMVHGSPCHILSVTPGEIQCVTPPCPPGAVDVNVAVHSMAYPLLQFTCNQTETPDILAVSPMTGTSGTTITIVGSSFGSVASNIAVSIDNVLCNVTIANDSSVECVVGHHAGGTFPIILKHARWGYAGSGLSFQYELNITSIIPTEGNFGGGAILTLKGAGFDQQKSQVFVCDSECKVEPSASTSSTLYCYVPPNNGTEPQQMCDVFVVNGDDLSQLSNGFTYTSTLTPVITAIDPSRGGTAGGTKLTITGAGFSSNINETVVTIAEAPCEIQFVNETNIVCVTNAQSPSQQTKVKVSVKGNGIAKLEYADFYYIDVWSSRYTWGGESPPERGSLVVITKGQTILLDQSTPILKMLLIQGGTLMFDEADIELQAENILITDGGLLQIGTEYAPFRHKAIITLHGHLRTRELPLYGAKTLAVREGTLDLHGLPVPVTWTHLSQTADAGTSTLILQKAVTWRPGHEIVIASTGDRHSQRENEKRTIEAVSANGQTLNLTEPLNYTHLGVSVTLPDGIVFEGRAEVGLLTRNIVVRGSNNVEWNDKIKACPNGFNTGEFATQTCFQGRFGEEIGSDQYGGCIMFHARRPSAGLVVGRIEYVEIYHAGQAFRLGRYPIHWHLMGNLSYESYVRGCAIHRTFNRAMTIHGTHHLLVESNVAYDIRGGAFFIEDGIERGNILQYNLAVMVRQSTSLLNDDLTPAAFWVTNPQNTVRHNAAAGGTHFGFWYRLLKHPNGPSHTSLVCPYNVPLGQFLNNTVHSCGRFGLWIFQVYRPMKGGRCNSGAPEAANFESLTSWNCEKGAEWVDGGALQFHNFLMVNNVEAGIEMKRIMRPYVAEWGEASGALIKNATIVGHVEGLGLSSDYCTRRGIMLPFGEGLTVSSVRFVNFDRESCAALGLTSDTGVCTDRCGGWSVRFSGVQYFDAANKAAFRWEHEVVLHDLDGSLTGNSDYKVVPQSSLLDPARCQQSTEWSQGYPGVVCDSTVNFHRLAFFQPSSSALREKSVVLSNSHGISIIPFLMRHLTHGPGWMALIPNNETFNWYFKDADHITNISYTAIFYHFKENDHVVISHNLTQRPDHFQVMGPDRNGSLQPLSSASNVNGDWYFDKENVTLYYLVSGKDDSQQPSLDPTMIDVNVQLRVFRCFFQNCASPPRATLPSMISAPAEYDVWSNSSFWKSSPENNDTVPGDGDSVVIPLGVWMVVDAPIPSMYNLTIYGVLEIKDENLMLGNHSSSFVNIVLNATYISIQGGRLIAGTHKQPFRGKLQIVLRGDHLTPDWPLPNGPNQGSKVLGVFGGLDLHGLPHLVYKTKLALTAPAGSTNLTLAEAVDWQEGDEILVTTTSYNSEQIETRTIRSISLDRRTLLLKQSLSYTHIAETHEVKGSGQSYTLAADIGLLSRNIKITGQDYPGWVDESFGARVLISSFSYNNLEFKGYARIKDVEFYHSGQKGYPDYYDPRYSVAFLNLGQIVGNDSYVRGCAFRHGFSPAIGVFGTDGLNVDDNIIYNTLGEGIRLWGNRNQARRNLVALIAIHDSWAAAIEVNEGSNIVLQENIVAGFQEIGYRINGEPCPGHSNTMAAWSNNEVHGGMYGVYMNKDGLSNCSLIQGFTIWKCWHYGIYFQTKESVQISNVTLVDNGMGIFPMIYGPPAISHWISNKTILINNALVVGISPNFNCSAILRDDSILNDRNGNRNPRQPSAYGRSGICWPTFASSTNMAPLHSLASLMSYPAISGLMTVQNTTFVGFKGMCSNEVNVMFITNPRNEDLQHPIIVKGITIVDSEERGKVFIHRPDVTKVNPADCVDMDCDAKKKTLLKDLDGSFLGRVGAVVPQSEYEWDGDGRHGNGDYRIPKPLLTYLNGSRIPVSQIAPHKGIIRDSTCAYMSNWQSYKCFGLNYEMLVIESLDPDTETRRLSPVALLSEGYIDLINGPQDHGWCSGYTCQKRISLFHGIVATNKSYDLYFTSTSPQNLRLMLLNTDDSRAVGLAIYYTTSQRLEVYANNAFVSPTNAEWNAAHTDFTLKGPTYTGEFVPKLDSSVLGANYFDREYQMLNVLVRGSTPIEIHTTPVLFISFNLPAMTVDEFYGPDLAQNLALFLNVPLSKIRITKIVREAGRRRKRTTGITVEVEIGDLPSEQFSAGSSNSTNTTSTEGKLQFSDLKEIASSLGEAMLTGNLSASLGFTISAMDISNPVPPPGDPQWAQMASKLVLSKAASNNHVATVAGLVVVQEPIAGYPGQLLRQQPSIMAVDDDDNCVSVGVTSWELDAVLIDSQNVTISGLNGTTTILFSGCWANYTDLSISPNGTGYKLEFQLKSIQTRTRIFSVEQTNNTMGKPPLAPSGLGQASLHSNRGGIIAGSVVGCLLLTITIAIVIWKITAGNINKVQNITDPKTRAEKQVGSLTQDNPAHALPSVDN
uniref:PKHD1 like 1, tandem duplicate 1 n=1 Tax=Pristiophorus japonicus TaxID=55135 RepID=UPI00398F2CC2